MKDSLWRCSVWIVGETLTTNRGFADDPVTRESPYFCRVHETVKVWTELFSGTPTKSSAMEIRIRRADCEVAGHN
jgi:hypothetical protein